MKKAIEVVCYCTAIILLLMISTAFIYKTYLISQERKWSAQNTPQYVQETKVEEQKTIQPVQLTKQQKQELAQKIMIDYLVNGDKSNFSDKAIVVGENPFISEQNEIQIDILRDSIEKDGFYYFEYRSYIKTTIIFPNNIRGESTNEVFIRFDKKDEHFEVEKFYITSI